MAKRKIQQKQYKSPKSFFVKDDDQIFKVRIDFFDEFSERNEALTFALEQYFELRRVLVEDAKEDDDLFIGPMKVTTGLRRTLDELNHRWPHLMEEITAVGRRMDGQRIAVC